MTLVDSSILREVDLNCSKYEEILICPDIKKSKISSRKLDRLFLLLINPKLEEDEMWILKFYIKNKNIARNLCHLLITSEGISKDSLKKLITTYLISNRKWSY